MGARCGAMRPSAACGSWVTSRSTSRPAARTTVPTLRSFTTALDRGAPPDAFSRHGQLWGNPLYDWRALRETGYHWWVERVRRTLALFDLARIDHFRGFVAYWAVPAGAADARRRALAARARAARCLRRSGASWAAAAARRRGPRGDHPGRRAAPGPARLPGMLVLQFGFDTRASAHRPTRARATMPTTESSTPEPTTTTPPAGWCGSLVPARRTSSTASWAAVGIIDRSRGGD